MTSKGIVVVVEGVDRAGKSSFVEALKDNVKAPWVTVHNAKQPDTNPDTSRDLYMDQVDMCHRHERHSFIFDRLHISEVVYSSLYRHRNRGMSDVDQHLPFHRTILVHVTRPLNEILDDGDGDSTWEQGHNARLDLENELAVFHQAMRDSLHPCIEVDWVNRGPQAIVAVMEAIRITQDGRQD